MYTIKVEAELTETPNVTVTATVDIEIDFDNDWSISAVDIEGIEFEGVEIIRELEDEEEKMPKLSSLVADWCDKNKGIVEELIADASNDAYEASF